MKITTKTHKKPMTVSVDGRVLCTVGSRAAAQSLRSALEWSATDDGKAAAASQARAAAKSRAKQERRFCS